MYRNILQYNNLADCHVTKIMKYLIKGMKQTSSQETNSPEWIQELWRLEEMRPFPQRKGKKSIPQ